MFFGREDQLGQLADLLKRPVASLVTCRGRRRIGAWSCWRSVNLILLNKAKKG